MSNQPCVSSWAISTGLVPNWASFSQANRDWATGVAQLVLWAATGRQFNACPTTVRPCWSRQAPLYQTWPVGLDGEGYWTLRGAVNSVELIGGGCGCSSSCACAPSQVAIPGAVAGIVSVQVDGVTLDPTGYLLQGNYLVRANNLEWPSSQNLSLPLGQPNTWGITYLTGHEVPRQVLDAAGIFAGELAKARAGGSCQLPNRVKSVARQGVDIQYIDTSDFLEKGLTGYDTVDMVIRAVNPYGLPAPLRVFSPDVPQFR